MIRAGIDDAEGVAAVGKVKIQPLHLGLGRVGKVNADDIAHAAGHLIHQAAGLAEVNVFRVLSDLGNFNGGEPAIQKQMVKDGSKQHLKGGGAGKPAAGQHRGGAVGVKATKLRSTLGKRRRDASDQGRSGILFFFVNRQVMEVHLHRCIPLRLHTDDPQPILRNAGRCFQIHSRRQNAAVLMIRVVAAQFCSARRSKAVLRHTVK